MSDGPTFFWRRMTLVHFFSRRPAALAEGSAGSKSAIAASWRRAAYAACIPAACRYESIARWLGSQRGGFSGGAGGGERLTAHLSGGRRGRASCWWKENSRVHSASCPPRLVPPRLSVHYPPHSPPPMPPLHTTSHPAPGVLLLEFNRCVLHAGLADARPPVNAFNDEHVPPPPPPPTTDTAQHVDTARAHRPPRQRRPGHTCSRPQLHLRHGFHRRLGPCAVNLC